MSESMTVEQKMARSIETWRKCDPILMASQPQAALIFAFRDMKRDILVLADEVERLRESNLSDVTRLADICEERTNERDELRRRVAELESGLPKVRADAVLDARECGVLTHEHGNNTDYSKGFDDAIAQYDAHMGKFADYLEANQIEGGE